MDDLISRQAAIDAIIGNMYIEPFHECNVDLVQRDYNSVREDDIEAIEQLPSVQPEIVRCKDCKHYKEWESEFTPNAVVTQCMADNFPISKAIPDGWFCAGAERRTDVKLDKGASR